MTNKKLSDHDVKTRLNLSTVRKLRRFCRKIKMKNYGQLRKQELIETIIHTADLNQINLFFQLDKPITALSPAKQKKNRVTKLTGKKKYLTRYIEASQIYSYPVEFPTNQKCPSYPFLFVSAKNEDDAVQKIQKLPKYTSSSDQPKFPAYASFE